MSKSSLIFALGIVHLLACGSSESVPTTSGPSATAGDSGVPSLPDSGTSDATTPSDAASTEKDGSSTSSDAPTCLAPQDITLGFSAPADASTKSLLDAVAISCGKPDTAEAVYRLTLTQPTTVRVQANDRSGSGIGVQVVANTCTGASVGCTFQANGVFDRTYPLPAGTWLFIVERAPAGPFSFSVGTP